MTQLFGQRRGMEGSFTELEKNDVRAFEEGTENKNFVLNILSLKYLSFVQLEVTSRQVEIQIWSSEKWSGPEMQTGFINVS